MSLLADIAVRGYTGSVDLKRQSLDLSDEPVAIRAHEISRGFFEQEVHGPLKQYDLDSGLYGRLIDLPVRPPFRGTWLEWDLPMRLDLVSPGGTYPTFKDGALVGWHEGMVEVALFCESPSNSNGTPLLIGHYRMKDEGGPFTGRVMDARLSQIGRHLCLTSAEESGTEVPEHPSSLASFYFAKIGALYIVDVALRMMHVKNVELAEVPRKRRKKQRRLRPDERISWRTVKVRPQGKQYAAADASSLPGMTSLHIVRGHFATYTAEKPLFGKYVGTYWREPHTRGSAEHGEVAKDYEVLA